MSTNNTLPNIGQINQQVLSRFQRPQSNGCYVHTADAMQTVTSTSIPVAAPHHEVRSAPRPVYTEPRRNYVPAAAQVTAAPFAAPAPVAATEGRNKLWITLGIAAVGVVFGATTIALVADRIMNGKPSQPAPVAATPVVAQPVKPTTDASAESVAPRLNTLLDTITRIEQRTESMAQRSQGGAENMDRLLNGISTGRDQLIEIKQQLNELRTSIDAASRAFGGLDAELSNPVALSEHAMQGLQQAIADPNAPAGGQPVAQR